MASENQQLEIELIGFTMTSVKQLQAQLEAELPVKQVHRLIHFKDEIQFRDVIHASLPHINLILQLGTATVAFFGGAALDAVKENVKEKIREWLKNMGAADADIILYGPDDKPIVKVKRREIAPKK